MKPVPSFTTLLMRAAVSGWFDPRLLLSEVADADLDQMSGDLSLLCDERPEGSDGRWMLKPTARRKALESLDRPITVEAALDGAPPVDGDAFGAILRAVLRGSPQSGAPARAGRGTEEDALRHAALQFAGYAPVVNSEARVAAFDQTRARIAAQQVENELSIVLPDRLFGRTTQLGRIIGFAKGTDPDNRPLLVTGIGGVGKSALMAAVMRRWKRIGHVAISIDFDRPDLTGADPLPVMREILRRLETAWIDRPAEPRWADAVQLVKRIREDMRGHQAKMAGYDRAEEQQRFIVSAVISQLRDGLAASVRREPLLVIFDSFEVVGVLGADVVHRLLNLTTFMQTEGGCSGLRIVVSGREVPLPEDTTFSKDGRSLEGAVATFGAKRRRIDVRGLTEREGAEFLGHIDRRTRFPDPATRRDIARTLRGHPLALMVLERFARDRSEAELTAIVADLQNDPNFTAELAQSFVYSRILDRISDPEVEKLAHPGLVLRRVTPDLIRLVLAQPCGLGDVSAERAEALLEKLASEYWLVQRVDAGQVRHRPDLRRLMLPGLFAGPRAEDNEASRHRKVRLREATLAVCQRAALHYEEGPQPHDAGRAAWEALQARERRVEAAYYRALGGDPAPAELRREIAADLRDNLGADLETLPVAWRAVIRASLGDYTGLSTIERASLTGVLRERAESASIEVKIRTGQGMEAASDIADESLRREDLRESGAKVNKDDELVERRLTASPGPKFSQSRSLRLEGSDLVLQEQKVRAMFADLQLEKASEAASVVLEQYLLGNVSELSRKQIFSNQLWATGLWESALVVAGTNNVSPFDLSKAPLCADGFPAPVGISTWLLLSALGGLPLHSSYEQLQDQMVSDRFTHTFRSIDGLRFAVQLIHALGDLPPQLDRKIDVSALALADAAFIDRLLEEQGGTNVPEAFAKVTHEIKALLRKDLSLSALERLYVTDVRVPLPDSHILQDETSRLSFIEGVVGLSPELHGPATRLMQRLTANSAAQVAEAAAQAATHWPIDLWIMQEGQGQPSGPPRSRRPYVHQLAATVVQTADRCGVFERLLLELARFAPEAHVLFVMHGALNSRVLFSMTNRVTA